MVSDGDRLHHCTYLRGAALSAAAEALSSGERLELELVSRERADALIFALASSGAEFEIKYPRTEKVVSLALYRQGVEASASIHTIADVR